MFLDAWKPDYKKFFDLVYPRLSPGGVFLAHNVINKKNEMEPFLQAHPDAIPACSRPSCRPSGEGMSVSVTRTQMKPVHIIGVPLDLGGGRRGVDMGPSAFRIAGLGDQIAALGRSGRRQGRPAGADPRDAARRSTRARSTSSQIARVCRQLYASAPRSRSDAGALPLVLGGDHSLAAGSVAASADVGAADDAACRSG